MKVLPWLCVCVACALTCGVGWGGAWTLPQGKSQIITEVSYSHAGHQFGRSEPVAFNKVFVKDLYEYAWSDAFGIFSSLQYVSADMRYDRESFAGRNFAYEAGMHVRVLSDPAGVVSLQASVGQAQPFTETTSHSATSSRQAEVRILYGNSFRIAKADSFVDVETAWRWASYPRPNEVVSDATLGVWILPDSMVMAQLFNTFSAGYGRAPYTAYRLHKCEVSFVQRLWTGVSIQLGGQVSVGGRNVVAERGGSLSLWVTF